MPPKAKFTKEEIAAAGLKIVRERGISAVTARELAKTLGSSPRPIFTLFAGMEEVFEAVRAAAKLKYTAYVEEGLSETPAFKGVGMKYIQFAADEPKLFQLLFMSETEGPAGLERILPRLEQDYEKIVLSILTGYGLGRETAVKIYGHMWVYTHGIAVLIATKVCAFTQAQIDSALSEMFRSLFVTLKGEEAK